jgi:hypothetical protein
MSVMNSIHACQEKGMAVKQLYVREQLDVMAKELDALEETCRDLETRLDMTLRPVEPAATVPPPSSVFGGNAPLANNMIQFIERIGVTQRFLRALCDRVQL